MNPEHSPKHKVQYINETILNTPQPQASSTIEKKGVLSYRFHKKNDIEKKTNENLDNVPTRDIDTMSVKSNSSRLSSNSSLGLLSLDNMEDFHDYMNNISKNGSITNNIKSTELNAANVNEKLKMQRILAQKALEKADAKSNTGGLPSYLLKPSNTPVAGMNNISNNTTPFRNESTINLSDLEKSPPKFSGVKSSDISDKLSFEAKEISARSSSFGSKFNSKIEDEVIDLRSPSPARSNSVANDFSSKCQSIYDKIRKSDISLAEICDRSSRMGIHTQPLGSLLLPDIETINISLETENSWCNNTQDSLIAKLQNELFTPAELAGDKLLAGELSWRKEKDVMPVDCYNNSKNAAGESGHMELSCFSGYVGSEDLSLKSDTNEKMSIGEFFKRKTEKVDKLNLKASPEKKPEPIAMINITADTVKFDESLDTSAPRSKCPLREETQIRPTPSNEFSRMSTESIMSVSCIADILSNMEVGDTPSRIIDLLLKKPASSSENYQKTSKSDTLPHKVESKFNTTSKYDTRTDNCDNPGKNESSSNHLETQSFRISENTTSKLTDSTKTLTQDSVIDISSKENSRLPNKSPQIVAKKSTESILKDTTNILEKLALEQQNIQSAQHNDVDNNVLNLKNATSEGDWTDAKQSGSYTPDYNRTLSSITESPSYSCSELEFSEDENAESAENSRTENWLEIEQETNARKLCINIPHKTCITVTSLTNHWLLVKVHVKDLRKLAKTAKIELFNEEGLLKSEAQEHLDFKITSLVTGKLEIVLKIELTDMATKTQKHIYHRLIFESEEPQLQISNETLDFSLNCEGCIKKMGTTVYNCSSVDLPLTFVIAQEIEWIYVFVAETDLEEPGNKDKETITMKSSIIPAGGSTKLYIDMRCPNLAELHCSTNQMDVKGFIRIYIAEPPKLLKEINLIGGIGLTKIQFKSSCIPLVLMPGQTKVLQVRNSGIVTMELTSKLVDETDSPINTYFTVEESSIVVKPGQIGTVSVSFNFRDKSVGLLKRKLKLQYPRGPGFVFPIEGITDDKNFKLSPNVNKSKTLLVTKSPRASPVDSRHSKDHLTVERRSVERNSASPNPSDRASTRTSQTGRSSTNSSDSGTLSYLQGGKLPIESTRTELVWGCVKPGKTVSQEFILRNRCSQRVRLQTTINGAGFKLIKDQTESVTSMSLMLHSLESRTITVSFSPNAKGAAAAKLMFLPIDNDVIHTKRQMVTVTNTLVAVRKALVANKKQLISLYGYGGYSNVDIQKVAKDTSSKLWLSFGRLDYRGILQQSFILRNTGSLAAFACLNVGCKVLYPFMDSSVKLSPTEVVIQPNKEVEISVNFTPRQEDFKYIQTNSSVEVSEIASINILSGPEPTRGRIRRLFTKMSNQGTLPYMTNEFLIPRLSGTFVQERMPLDLLNCKESPGAMKELLQDLVTREIALTIEHDPDKSGIASVLGADESCMFLSLCSETAQMTLDASYGHNEIQNARRASGGFCTVEPTRLMLTPPMKTEDTVLVSSKHSRPMPFEISIPNSTLQVSPTVGVVPPGETSVVTISCNKTQPKPLQFFKVMIYVENEVMEIEVKIHFVQPRRS